MILRGSPRAGNLYTIAFISCKGATGHVLVIRANNPLAHLGNDEPLTEMKCTIYMYVYVLKRTSNIAIKRRQTQLISPFLPLED